ncbi:integrase family protein [Rhizobium sp. Kim5]|uniref:tyrosine-type recombinase/integrase n=1 Tax=Rhizobium sp. Kim5 TaxID=2020311 RepID=UPI0001906580|nr:tyrosine-type recombinase/integrase [Rhizobium sp. Kim5]ARQ58924.1 integrase family protein [Rhizobium sp. Kim5]
MPSEVFSKHTFNKVITLIRKGVDAKVKYADKECSGLAIILNPTNASWYISTRDMNVQIAPFNAFSHDDLDKLRKFVTRARQEKKEGKDIEALVATFAKSGSVDDALTVHDVEHNGALRWEPARDLYLEWLLLNRNKNTHRSYKSALGAVGLASDFEPVAGKPLAAITTTDLVRVRENVTRRGREGNAKGSGIRQANLTVSAIKAAFTWFINKPDVFALKSNPASDLRKSMDRDPKTKTLSNDRALTQMEIGAFIYGLEEISNTAVRSSLMLQLLAGQRRFTPVSAKVADFTKHPHYRYTWSFEDKSHAWRCLPCTDDMALLVKTSIRLAEGQDDSDYLFPKQRPKRTGDDMSGHINERTISRCIEEMRKPGGILGDIDFVVATHDLRKSFITHMGPRMGEFYIGNRQLEPDDVEMITHKNEGRDRVSSLRYDKNTYLDVKLEILEAWAKFCYEGYTMYVLQLQELQKDQAQKKAA